MAVENNNASYETPGGGKGTGSLKTGLEVDGIQLQEILLSTPYERSFKGWSVEDASFVFIKFFHATAEKLNEEFIEKTATQINAINSIECDSILEITTFGVYEEYLYTVTPWVEGGELSNRLQNRESRFVQKAYGIISALSEALLAVHNAGLVHCNLKTSSVVFDEKDRPYLTDFGISALSDLIGTRPDTEKSVAVERKLSQEAFSPAVDIFSLGVLIYEMLTGRTFSFSKFELPNRIYPDMDPRWNAIVERSTRYNPLRRFTSVADMCETLNSVLSKVETFEIHCHECGAKTSPHSLKCETCGADLIELFDTCPKCKRMTPLVCPHCIHCGCDMSDFRVAEGEKVASLFNEAERLEDRSMFREAVSRLQQIVSVEGGSFRRERQKAQARISKLQTSLMQQISGKLALVKKQIESGQLSRAIELLDELPEENADTKTLKEISTRRISAVKEALQGAIDAASSGDEAEATHLSRRARELWKDSKVVRAVSDEVTSMLKLAVYDRLNSLLSMADKAMSQDDFEQARSYIEEAIRVDIEDPDLLEVLSTFKKARARRGFLCTVMLAKKAILRMQYQEAYSQMLSASRWLPYNSRERIELAEIVRSIGQEDVSVEPLAFKRQWEKIKPYGTTKPDLMPERETPSAGKPADLGDNEAAKPSGDASDSGEKPTADQVQSERSRAEIKERLQAAGARRKQDALMRKPGLKSELQWFDFVVAAITVTIVISALVYLARGGPEQDRRSKRPPTEIKQPATEKGTHSNKP